ncbi:shikimate kinase [Flavobacterium arsenatis]|uniref:Shikimate kinase n=1 Tax=Flavobacterium arsenatis TaxID=1484332 RepID=A0ABU1TQX4_9FLAO|nr:shikimate kinase [Flavobacterium arsenatis]MDR6968323.1 shikimate kinase [Flavobacterium arsenatis]
MRKIIILGYMGSGKTTIAKLLSEKINLKVLDLDKIIEERLNLSVKTIFETKGEIYFRKIEHQIFSELMKNDESMILSLGGGTPCYAENHLLLNGEGVTSIYLKASIETLFERLSDAKSERPLLSEMEEEKMKEFIAKHLFDRIFYYNQATIKLSVDGKDTATIVKELEDLLA